MTRIIARPSVSVSPALAALLVALLSFGPVAAQQQQEVTLTATDSAITPRTVTLRVGQPVQLTIRNTGREDHNLKSDVPLSNANYIKADNDPANIARYIAQNILDVDYKVGNTSTVVFTPTRAGAFEFFSDEQPDDRAAGMVGTFQVSAGAQGAPGQLPRTGDSGPDGTAASLGGLAIALIATALAIRRLRRAPTG